MAKKIGILTFQGSSNYGAIMQAYALNKAINSFGAHCETIDYRCQAIEKANKVEIKSVKDILKNIYKCWKEYQCKKFVSKEIVLSRTFDRETIKDSDHDIYFVGSDQVWNPRCTENDGTYFLDFLTDGKKKYSYAASIGLNGSEAIQIIDDHKTLLEDFSSVSFREHIDDCVISNLLSTKVRYDIDPVFLLSKDNWLKVCNDRCIKDKYIFVYLIGEPCRIGEFIANLQEKTGLKVIDSKKSIEFMMHCKPYDFLSWIYNAEFIVTNSFHGTALSIIMQKIFYVECMGKSGFNYRVDNLLKLVNLETQKIDGNLDCNPTQEIDYSKVERIIEGEVQRASDYLKSVVC